MSNSVADVKVAAKSDANVAPENHKTVVSRFKSCFDEVPYAEPKPVFRLHTQFITDPGRISFEVLACDTPSIISGEHSGLINKYKRSHDWVWSSVVAIVAKDLNKADDALSCWATDISTFLHVFYDVDSLREWMRTSAESLAAEWSELNGPEGQASARRPTERIRRMDFRNPKESYSNAGAVVLELIGSNFNFTCSTQDVGQDIICDASKIYYTLKYRSPNGFLRRSGLYMPIDEWLALIQHPLFKQFHSDLWASHPLTSEYTEKLNAYWALCRRKEAIAEELKASVAGSASRKRKAIAVERSDSDEEEEEEGAPSVVPKKVVKTQTQTQQG